MFIKIFMIYLFTLLILNVNCRRFLKEKPDFFEECTTKDPDFNECYKDNLQALIANLKDGISGLPDSTKMEPVKIKRIKIAQNQIAIEVNDAIIHGLGDVNLTKLVMHSKDLKLFIKANVPQIHLNANYKMAGRILFLPLNGNGTLEIETENMDFNFVLKMQLKDYANFTFAEIKSVRSRIKHIGDFHLQLNNLFNGNKELETQANAIFNENWRHFIEILRPTLQDTLDAVVLARLRKVFYFIPLNYFISDVLTAKELYGSNENDNKIK